MWGQVKRVTQATPEQKRDDRELLEREWQKLKSDFERTMPRSRKLIYIIHEGYQFLQVEEATDVVAEILSVGKRTPVDLILHTLGGSAAACEMIAEALVKRPNTRAFVPFYALSAGTEIALATTQVVFGQHGALGPTDIQFRIPQKDLEQLEEAVGFENLPVDLQLMIIHARSAVKRDIKTVCRLINRKHVPLAEWLFGKCKLASKLSSGEMPHDHRITYKEARRLGIHVSRRMPKNMYQFVVARRRQLKKLQELDDAIRVVNAKGARSKVPDST